MLCDGEMNIERIAKCAPVSEPKMQTFQFLRMLMPLKSLLLQKHIVWQWYPRHYISICCDAKMRKHQASPSRTYDKNTRNRISAGIFGRAAVCNGYTIRINLICIQIFPLASTNNPKHIITARHRKNINEKQ